MILIDRNFIQNKIITVSHWLAILRLPILFTAQFPSFEQGLNLKQDASVARQFTSISFYIVNAVKKMLLLQTLLQESVIHLR